MVKNELDVNIRAFRFASALNAKVERAIRKHQREWEAFVEEKEAGDLDWYGDFLDRHYTLIRSQGADIRQRESELKKLKEKRIAAMGWG